MNIESMFTLKGKVAFVTGATGYLGKAIVYVLGAAGAHVIHNGSDESKILALTKDMEKAGLSVEGAVFDIVCSQSWIDGVVVGVETSEQLCENLRQLDNDNWATDVHSMIILDRPIVPVETLNPAKWNQNNV
jgi:NAD(P)-dependent dehydrogenase (short-subunit alcohol dehydrogenase family)